MASGLVENPSGERDLTPDQQRFAIHYAETLSVRESEREAGISEGYGHQLLRKPHVRAFINHVMEQAAEHINLKAGLVVREAAWLAFSDVTEILDTDLSDIRKLPTRVRRSIKKVKQRTFYRTTTDEEGNKVQEVDYVQTELELHSKIDALKLLALATGAVSHDDDKAKGVQPFQGFNIITGGAANKRDDGDGGGTSGSSAPAA